LLVVAHRGASLEAPENTIAAFTKAIEIGADMIEFDVRRHPAGTLVVSHDPVRAPAQNLPTLEETLLATKGRIQLDVELKETGCAAAALELLLRHFSIADFCITSFLPEALQETRAARPGVRTGLIFAHWRPGMRALCESPAVDFLVPHYRFAAPTQRFGKPLFVWTVDDPARTSRLFERPLVEAVITNNPRQAIALRAASSSQSH
jgi:glycerophosphoryl diester phosphodiesterase